MTKHLSRAWDKWIVLTILTLLVLSAALVAPSILAAPKTDAVVAGLVWGDHNGDGLANDGDDSGLADVVLRFIIDDGDQVFEPGADDTLMTSVTTAADGRYQIALPIGSSFWIDVDQSALTGGLEWAPGPDSSPEPALVAVTAGDVPDVNFGYAPRGSIWGTVFYDRNVDGQHGPGEGGVADVQICLYRDLSDLGQLDAGDQLLSCHNTDSQGNYAFGSLLYGDYLVAESARPGVGNSTPNLRAVFLDPWLVTGAEAEAIGDVLLASASGMIYIDTNGNGRHDPAENLGVRGVPVQATSLATGEVTMMQSDSQGRYTIASLMPGVYLLEAPAVFSLSVRSSPGEITTTLAFGQQLDGVDYGYVAPTRVTLVSFVAEQAGNGVRLRWSTGFEQNQDGFIILRGAGLDKPFSAISSVIPARNDPEGAAYEWVDASAAAGSAYWYKLQSLPDGELFGPVATDSGRQFRLFMPNLSR